MKVSLSFSVIDLRKHLGIQQAGRSGCFRYLHEIGDAPLE